MAAPAGTPDDILDTLAQAVAEAQKTAPVQERFNIMEMFALEQIPPAICRKHQGRG